MGPSGSGKDSLIRFVRERLSAGTSTVFAHRYITRPPSSAHENFISLSRIEFDMRARHGLFLFNWSAYDNHYAVGIEAKLWLEKGLTVVVSGSRKYYQTAMDCCPDLIPILIDAPASLRRQRLLARGRETPPDVESRLARNTSWPSSGPRPVTIENTGALDAAGLKLLRLLEGQTSSALPAGPAR
jgi:ribose 1,5-bisphosphokinase